MHLLSLSIGKYLNLYVVQNGYYETDKPWHFLLILFDD